MNEAFKHEWEILHRDHERYEQFALVIKLFGVALVLWCWVFAVDAVLTIIFLLVLWLQEGIWKTYQARIGARILRVEQMLLKPGTTEGAPYQLYSTWSAQPKHTASVIAEYVACAIRPTVAYPYAVLILLTIGAAMFNRAPF
jgi:hypothetical protein